MTAFWIVVGVFAVVGIQLLVLGLCKAAKEGDQQMGCDDDRNT